MEAKTARRAMVRELTTGALTAMEGLVATATLTLIAAFVVIALA